MLDVHLRRFGRVMHRVMMMPMRGMGVVRCLFVSTSIIMLRGLLVVSGRMLMVLGRFPVMFCWFSGHRCLRADLNVMFLEVRIGLLPGC